MSKERLPQIDTSVNFGKGYSALSELMRAMILRAVDDFNSTGEHHDEAIEWLFSEEEEYVFSFRAVCHHLGFNPEKTRERIMNPTHKISTRRRAA